VTTEDKEAADRIIWVDCEMTGLDLHHDALIEISCVVTDSQLNVLGDGVDVIIKPPAEAMAQMTPFVHQMHEKSGLINELDGGTTLADADAQVMDYVTKWVPVAGKAPLGGNSVSTDRTFIDRDLPRLSAHLHYRTIDVSSVKELARRWYPRIYYHLPEKKGGHRALGDILDSIDELRYYREIFFVPEPGPTSDAAKAAGEHVTETSVRVQFPAGAAKA
jgi:oligoribonuclease